MSSEIRDDRLVHLYYSVEEMLDNAQKGYEQGQIGYSLDSYMVGRRDLRTWKDMAKAAREPWQEGLDHVQEMFFELDRKLRTPELKISRRRPTYSEEGGHEVELNRLLGGQDDYWRTCKRKSTVNATTVSILINNSTA